MVLGLRHNGILNRASLPSDIIAFVVFRRLRTTESLRDHARAWFTVSHDDHGCTTEGHDGVKAKVASGRIPSELAGHAMAMDGRGLNIAWLIGVANGTDGAVLAVQFVKQHVIRFTA